MPGVRASTHPSDQEVRILPSCNLPTVSADVNTYSRCNCKDLAAKRVAHWIMLSACHCSDGAGQRIPNTGNAGSIESASCIYNMQSHGRILTSAGLERTQGVALNLRVQAQRFQPAPSHRRAQQAHLRHQDQQYWGTQTSFSNHRSCPSKCCNEMLFQACSPSCCRLASFVPPQGHIVGSQQRTGA